MLFRAYKYKYGRHGENGNFHWNMNTENFHDSNISFTLYIGYDEVNNSINFRETLKVRWVWYFIPVSIQLMLQYGNWYENLRNGVRME